MKRLLLLLPLLLTPAAQAVDYVRCDAMVRAKARVEEQLRVAVSAETEKWKDEFGNTPLQILDPDRYAEFQAALKNADPVASAELLKVIADWKTEGCF